MFVNDEMDGWWCSCKLQKVNCILLGGKNVKFRGNKNCVWFRFEKKKIWILSFESIIFLLSIEIKIHKIKDRKSVV